METYQSVSEFAQTWGLIYFVFLFLAVLAYVLWPRNGRRFDDAAQIPLRED
ncbi:MAG: cbb3-type cytochrome c oxidase subunit 3 [Ancalomicrobiaceae bacterium]|nr:cbb3-type cytochrome c oxidase subunit 3 [Ancalomicrobiaceae bacterium]